MPSRPEPLSSLARRVGGRIVGDTDPLIVDVSHDSRAVGPGSLFVAVPGRIHDGHRFAAEAISAGAAAVCVQRVLDVDRPQLVVPDTRAVLGRLAAAVWGDPSQRLFLVGVTGTNGKTTVTHLVESIGRAAGGPDRAGGHGGGPYRR
ncbi:MAG: hypothetical protein KatS3mg011_1824 [Acidimicrobiia bacterium]|nr:MAG: hypothetical protein KatS3mg011_1824 [Acidimicrobiia bacterium]